jgi:hypothetical protein
MSESSDHPQEWLIHFNIAIRREGFQYIYELFAK